MSFRCKENKLSQAELGKLFGINGDITGNYEMDEIRPFIDADKYLAKILDTSVGYLLGGNVEANLL